jgi:hypothetical protein
VDGKRVTAATRRALWVVLSLGCVPADPPGGPRRKRAEATDAAATETERAAAPDAGEGGPREFAVAEDPRLTEAFTDDFERAELGPDYAPTAAVWRIEAGRLCGRGARNRPVWLRRRLPPNVRVEFDGSSGSRDGDIKVELFGDGRSRARSRSYIDATSYIVVFGGFKNSLHVLARLDEHGADRRELALARDAADARSKPVEANRRYRFKLERLDGETLHWFVDGVPVLRFADPEPLRGEGHEYFAFNDWEAPVCFDNLVIYPLGT